MQDVDDGNTRGDLREPDKTANLWMRFGECGTLMLAFTFLSREDGRGPHIVLSSQCLSISVAIQHDVLMSLKRKVLESQIKAKALVCGLMGSCCDRYSRLAPCSCRVHLCQSATHRASPGRRIPEIRIVQRNPRKFLCEAYGEHRFDAAASSGSAPRREKSQFGLGGLKC
jgi:hypothetical protein